MSFLRFLGLVPFSALRKAEENVERFKALYMELSSSHLTELSTLRYEVSRYEAISKKRLSKQDMKAAALRLEKLSVCDFKNAKKFNEEFRLLKADDIIDMVVANSYRATRAIEEDERKRITLYFSVTRKHEVGIVTQAEKDIFRILTTKFSEDKSTLSFDEIEILDLLLSKLSGRRSN